MSCEKGLEAKMEASIYKELSYKLKGVRVASFIVALVTVVLCLVIGIGCWVLIAGVQENEKLVNEIAAQEDLVSGIRVVEGEVREPLRLNKDKGQRVVHHVAEIDFADGSPLDTKESDVIAQAHMQEGQNTMRDADSIPVAAATYSTKNNHPKGYKTTFSHKFPMEALDAGEVPSAPFQNVDQILVEGPVEVQSNAYLRRIDGGEEINGQFDGNFVNVAQEPAIVYTSNQQQTHKSMIQTLSDITNNMATALMESPENIEKMLNITKELYKQDALTRIGSFMGLYGQKEQTHPREKRFVQQAVSMAERALSYATYLGLGNFLRREVSDIAEHKMEFQARKLSDDPHAEFLDSQHFAAPTKTETKTPAKTNPSRTPAKTTTGGAIAAAINRWEPSVNKIPLNFMANMLTTLLNLMREFLLKDHAMECMWFMFCQDLNHQAKYSDIYGVLARVNSVGLKVLTTREDRDGHMDTVGEVWRSLTAWAPMTCDAMFPKCDGSKALEIVNEVALGL